MPLIAIVPKLKYNRIRKNYTQFRNRGEHMDYFKEAV